MKLCSYGFENHDDISKKFRILCEAPLSKQQLYDFGLRNILSVINEEEMKRKNSKKNLKK